MSAKIQTEFGCAVPPAPRHAITFHLPLWSNLLRFVARDQELLGQLKSVYPRMMMNKDVKNLAATILKHMEAAEDQILFIFTSPTSATECIEFAVDPKRGENVVPPEEISIRIFDIHVRLHTVLFPAARYPTLNSFWQNAGAGISSRLAEECLDRINVLHQVIDDSTPPPKVEQSPAHGQIQERIAGLLERAPVGPPREAKASPEDVYLFQTGMAAIYCLHRYLLKKQNGGSVLFGYAFHSTLHVFDDFGPNFKLFALGNEQLDELEDYLTSETEEGRKVQAIWTEFPANPLLITPDLGQLRKLANKYGSLLIVDDTVGSFCNVDVLGVADVVITSLTKSFSGYADVMAASAVLNPSGSRYTELKSMYLEFYCNNLANPDAVTLEHNSRDYLARSKILNSNSLRLVEYLQTKAADPTSSVSKVYYTTTSPSLPYYKERMRPATADFTPGYGCLFSFEFDTLDAMAAFYDNINVHISPHLGAHLTLALPYVKGIYGQDVAAVKPYGLKETQMRIAPGLEDIDLLLKDFEKGLVAADATRVKET
ncbi:putative cystathionine gamma-synthase [Lachnellula subtilissima]|uniref:Putative cystathionine gamma-synthase n=1 Tax=Lachnellula subtilissima TaxID=602034 RepID=A0A8H8S181_9HELO|nr:putative cystathionine gamma-synthase [Lachnellula subtilissima]